MDFLPAKRDPNQGIGNPLSKGFELAATVGIFLFLGWLVDRAAGTQPVFMICFVVFALAGVGLRMWLGYDQEMRRQQDETLRRIGLRSGVTRPAEEVEGGEP